MSGTRWSDDREIGWYCVRSALCTRRRGARVSYFGLKTKMDGLSVVWPQNHWVGFLGLVSKPRTIVCQWFGLKNTGMGFPVLTSKLVATVWWFVPQSYHDGFLFWTSKSSGIRFVSCTTKSTGGWRRRGARVEIWQFASRVSKLGYGFPVWPQDWRKHNDGWCMWHHHECHMRIKSKREGSIR
jgi:hypothetical protein